MKAIRTISAAAIFSIMAILSTASASEINVRLNNYKKFKFTIDNEVYKNATSYNIRNISQGFHNITSYEFTNGNNYNRLIFSGRVYIPGNKIIDAVISKNGGFKITREVSMSGNNGGNYGNNGGNHGGNGGNYGNNGGNYGGNGGYYGNNGGNNGGNYGNNNYGNDDYVGGNYGNNGYGNNGGYNNDGAMRDYEFGMLLSTIRNTSFDSSKIDVAKTALMDNRVYSKQVLELVKLYSFESSKLEVAKFAYSRTIDKGNYFLVNGAFNFSSSTDELNRFIRNGGH